MFEEICELISNHTGFIKGSTMQMGHRVQNAPKRCVLISESGGGSTIPELADYADVLIQVISRGETYFNARDDAYVVYRAMHGTAGWNMPNLSGSGPDYIAWTVEALAIPQYIGQPEDGAFEFSTNYIFRCSQASCGAAGSGSI
jgi:hypothetical protein